MSLRRSPKEISAGTPAERTWTPCFFIPQGSTEFRAGIPSRRISSEGVVVRLEDVLDQRFSTIPFVIELKTGKGNTTRALEFILDRLEHSAHGRYWVDSFSPELLAEVKKISPGTPTSLHTRLGVYGPVFVRTSFEPIPVGPPGDSLACHRRTPSL